MRSSKPSRSKVDHTHIVLQGGRVWQNLVKVVSVQSFPTQEGGGVWKTDLLQLSSTW